LLHTSWTILSLSLQTQLLILSTIVGVGEALVQSGVWPLAASIHPRCTAAAGFGAGVAGLFVGLLRLVTKAGFPETEQGWRASSSFYFGIATFVIGTCAVALYVITKFKEQMIIAFFEREHAVACKSFLLDLTAIKREMEQELADLSGDEEKEEVPVRDSLEEEAPDDNALAENDNAFDTLEVNLQHQQNNSNMENKKENTTDDEKKFHLFSVFFDATHIYRVAFLCAYIPILTQFVNAFITLSIFPGLGKSKMLCIFLMLINLPSDHSYSC
jgi:hypothetical protein